MRELLQGAWYRVRTDAPEGALATSSLSLEALADLLPHGSGIDGDWFISFRPRYRGRITLHSEYHVMDGNGYYAGWRPFRAVLDYNPATGLSVRSVRINQRGYGYGLADMLHETIDWAINHPPEPSEVR